jgi:hypothetical protein
MPFDVALPEECRQVELTRLLIADATEQKFDKG